MHQLSIAKWVPLNEWDTIVLDRDKMLVALKKWRPFFWSEVFLDPKVTKFGQNFLRPLRRQKVWTPVQNNCPPSAPP